MSGWEAVREFVETSEFWSEFVYRDELDSTNRFLRNYEEQQSGTIVLARTQLAGRGKGKRKWHSPPGGLWFSFSLGELPAESPQKLYVEILEILRGLLADYGADTRISRPNDLVVDDGKVAGSLIEQSGESYIVGLGLNVNNDLSRLPKGVRRRSKSLSQVLGREVDRDELLREFLDRFERYCKDD